MECNICRVCLKMCSVVHSLYQKDIPELLENLTSIKIWKNDDFPESCCETCWKNICVTHTLQKLFKKSNEKLQMLIKTDGNYDQLYVSTSNSLEVDVKVEDEGSCDESVINTDDNEDYYDDNMDLDPLQFREIMQERSNGSLSVKDESSSTDKKNTFCKTDEQTSIVNAEVEFKNDFLKSFESNSKETGDDSNNEGNYEPNINDILAQVQLRMTDGAKKDDLSKYYERLETPDDIIKRLKPTASRKYSFYCTICEKTYNGVSLQHKYQHIKAKCKICGIITRADNIRKHILLHQWGSQLCDICGSSHKSIEGLRSHIYNFHTRKDPYKCDECGEEFKLSGKLAYHKRRIHIGGRDYVCDECGKAFFSSETRKKHRNLVHLNLRPHICDFCQRGFSSPYALKTHRRQHTGELPFLCNLCDAGYRQAVSLRTHMKSKHKIIVAVNKPGVTYKQQKEKLEKEIDASK